MRTITFNADPEDYAAAVAVTGNDELNRAIGYAAAWGLAYPKVRITLFADRKRVSEGPLMAAVYLRDDGPVVFYMEASYNKETKRFEFRS